MAFKRRNRFDKRIRFKRKIDLMYLFLFVVLIGLGIGYASFSTGLNINGDSKLKAASWDVHFENLRVTTGSVATETPAHITSDTTVEFGAKLTDVNDFYEFTVNVVNNGTMDAMIDEIEMLPVLTEDQQIYLGYNVTYLDDMPLDYNQKLKAKGSETIKVNFYYLDSDDKSVYPEVDETLNISCTISYVQADENAIPVQHEIYRWSTYEWAENQDISSFTVGTDYVIDKSKVVNMHANANKYFLKYHVESNKITDKYACFVISNALAQEHPGITAGEYCLIGKEGPETFLDNSKIIYDAFGSMCSFNPYETTPSGGFDCKVPGVIMGRAFSSGIVDAGNTGENYCYVNMDGTSKCYDG